MIKVCFVCTANICRSPTAEGVFKKLIKDKGYSNRLSIDSAGTHGGHVGRRPDRRAQKTARKHGVDISGIRSRILLYEDFVKFDYLIGMDRFNLENMKKQCPDGHEDKIYSLLSFAPQHQETEIPDPYEGSSEDFDRVMQLIEVSSMGLLAHIAMKFDWTGISAQGSLHQPSRLK